MLFRYLVPFLFVFVLSQYVRLAHATLDAVFANMSQPNPVCLNDEMGRFSCSDVSANTDVSLGVALGDVNNDTFLDIVFANQDPVSPNLVCLGDGTGRFSCSDVNANSRFSRDVALGSVNGDPFLDAVFASGIRSNQVCLGDGTGRFSCSGISASGWDVALGNVNNDPFLDAVFAYSSNQVCLGDGTGGFTCSDVSADINSSEGVALGDMNGDLFLDAVFANTGTNQVCLGDGTGRFTCSDVSADTNSSWDVALGNVNNDSFLDAVFANTVLPPKPNRVCLGDGTGRFTCSDVGTNAHFSFGVALGEVDKPIVIAQVLTSIPTLSLWAWFLLSMLLAGMAMIVLRTML